MAEELIFRTVVSTDKAVKETEKLEKALGDVNKEVKNVNANSEDSLNALNERMKSGNLTMREAKQLVKEYSDLALQAGRETPIGQEAIMQAGELKDRIGDLRTEVQNAGTDGANLKAALQFGGAVVAGFGAIKGAMALMGGSSKELQEAMMKLQAVTAILVGVEQVRGALEKESLIVMKAKVIWNKLLAVAQYIYTAAVGTTTGAMKALRISMLAIPIFAIIAAIVALIAILAEFFSSEQTAEEQNNRFNESMRQQQQAMDDTAKVMKRFYQSKRELMQLDGATSQELHDFDMQRLADEEANRQENLALLQATMDEKAKIQTTAYNEGNVELAKTISDEITATQDKYHELKLLDGQYILDKMVLEKKYAADQAKQAEDAQKEQDKKNQEWAKKEQERKDAEAKKKLEEQKLLEDLLVANIEDANARKLAALQLQQKREMEETIKKYGEQSEVVKQLEIKQASDLQQLKDDIAKQQADDQAAKDKQAADEREAKAEAQRKSDKAELEGKLIQAREDFEAEQKLKKDLALLEMEQALDNTDLTEGEIFKIKQEYAQKIDDINQATVDREIERQKNLQDATKNVLQAGLDAGQGLADAFFDYKIEKAEKGTAEELRLEKRKFEVNKKLQIAQAIMQGIQATLAAYSSGSAIPIVGPVAGPAFAAAAAVTSALNIARIRATEFEGGATGTSVPTTSAPSVSFTQPNQQEPATTTNTASLQNNPTRVVMIDSELKAAIADNNQVSVVSNIG